MPTKEDFISLIRMQSKIHKNKDFKENINKDAIKNTQIIIGNHPMESFMMDYKLNIESNEEMEIRFKWFRHQNGTDDILLSEEDNYICSKNDVGYKIKIAVDVRFKTDHNKKLSLIGFSNTILPCMGPFLFEKRHLNQKKRETIRVISYNILASYYTKTKEGLNLIFKNTNSVYMDVDYRKRLILNELIAYEGDIIGLQELESNIFEYIYSSMGQIGFNGKIMLTTHDKNIGCGIFYNGTRFREIMSLDIHIGTCLLTHICNENIRNFLLVNNMEHILQKTSGLNSVCQFSVLQDFIFNKYIFILNTHLHAHPDEDDVRLIQIISILNYVTYYKNYFENNIKIKIILLGDLNSNPFSYNIRFLENDKDLIDWSKIYNSEIYNNPLQLNKISNHQKYFPETSKRTGLLDYIFIGMHDFGRFYSYPHPDITEFTENSLIPSYKIPSDHIPVIADLEYSQ